MKTDLPEGTWVRYRYRGELEYVQIVLHGKAIRISKAPPAGTVVHTCVWKKGDELISKGTVTL